MRGERETEPESLMARYGIGLRLATRVVALLSRQVDVTGTVLATAAADAALERLLLEQELLRETEAVTEASLQARASEFGCPEADLLRLVADPETGWRTIALEDDLLVAQARTGQASPPGRGGGVAAEQMSLVRAGSREISVQETQELFTPQDVARLKLSVLTSQDADERIEAIRKLVFAPVDGAQKAGIFFNVLTDHQADPRVRREAIRSLEQIGFRADMAEALRGLLDDNPQAAIYSIRRLGALLQEADEGEAALSLAVVLEVLDQGKNTEIICELLRLVGKCAAILVRNYQKTEEFIQSGLRHLAREFDQLRADVEAALAACVEVAPDLAAELMWKELRRSESARVRSLLLNLCESVTRGTERTAELAAYAVTEILNPDLPESEKARLRYGLVRLGEPVVLVALDRMAGADAIQKSELVRLLDVLCTESDVCDDTVQRAVRALVDLLKLADAATRRTVLQATVLGDPRVEASLQKELAGELLALMSELNLPDTLSAIRNTLERIGLPALVPCYEFMRRAYPSEAAQSAAIALGKIIQDHPHQVDDDLAGRILALCTELLEDERTEQGAFAITLASVCGYTHGGARRFDAALKSLTDNVWKLAYPMDVLAALGIMAGSENARRSHQKELFELFDGIVQFRPRTGIGRRKQTDEGTVYEFGREIEFDTRVVPSAVKGLERIFLSPRASQQMRTQIAKRLLILWEGVSKVRIVWGPAAIEALIGAMCSAACAPMGTVKMKVRLGTSLLGFLNKIGVIRSIGEICSQPHRSSQMRQLAVEAGTRVLDEWETSELQDDERRLALLRSAGRIASNPALDARSDGVRMLRERAMEALFGGLREGMDQVREPLLLMRECPDLSPAQKREIDDRLSKAFGLVRRSPQAAPGRDVFP